MALTYVDRARMSTATTGTGTITLGAAATAYQTFAAAGVTNGETVEYLIEDGNAWEIGVGTYNSTGPTLARSLRSSSTGSLINLDGNGIVTVVFTALTQTETLASPPPIGGTAANSGAFTTLETSGQYTANANIVMAGTNPQLYVGSTGASQAVLNIGAAAGQYRIIYFNSGALQRWAVFTTGENETGSNAGSNFDINSFNDAGVFLASVLTIDRASGLVSIPNLVSAYATITAGTIDDTIIGGSTPAAATFNFITVSAISGNAGTIDGVAIGGTIPMAGSFTTLSASSTVSGAGFTARFASPGPIGSTTPSTGAFTTVSATSTVSGVGLIAGTSGISIGSSAQASAAGLNFNTAAGQFRLSTFYTASAGRWQVGVDNTTESGSNAGSNYVIWGLNDAASAYTVQISVNRATGVMNLPNGATITGGTSNNHSIGATTPSTGAFTTLTANNTVTLAPVTANIGRNVLHNPLFNIQQRGTGPWTTANTYTADRWELSLASDTVSVSIASLTDTDRSQIGNEYAEYGLQCVVAGTSGGLTQMLQYTEDAHRTSNKTVVLSFYAKGSVALNVGAYMQQNFGSGGSPSAAVVFGTQSVSITTSWARYSMTFSVPSIAGKTFGTTANTSNLLVALGLSAGSSASPTLGVGVQSGTFEFWGMQLEIGPVASPLETKDLERDMMLCQRFYQVFPTLQVYTSYGLASGAAIQDFIFPVTMRIAPTGTLSAASYGNASGAVVNGTSVSEARIQITITGVGAAFGTFTAAFSADY